MEVETDHKLPMSTNSLASVRSANMGPLSHQVCIHFLLTYLCNVRLLGSEHFKIAPCSIVFNFYIFPQAEFK